MTYILIAIAAFMAITTTFILNSMSRNNKSKLIKGIAIAISILVYLIIAVFLLQQRSTY